MKRSVYVSVVILATTLSSATLAQQQEEGITGQVAFGFLSTSGNTESESLNLSFSGERVRDLWTRCSPKKSERLLIGYGGYYRLQKYFDSRYHIFE